MAEVEHGEAQGSEPATERTIPPPATPLDATVGEIEAALVLLHKQSSDPNVIYAGGQWFTASEFVGRLEGLIRAGRI